ncbi:hypothetical protein [Paraburkholderia terrae]|uniref:non-homologous end-joining DNA ligase LigD n=1 Tax=Paraburkholderia terrae TaxID=311230 RepID=UPI002FDDA320
MARHLAKVITQRFSAVLGPKNRIRRIFVNYLRNRKGATTVVALSPRARLGLPLSMPVRWDALPKLYGASDWNVETGIKEARLWSSESVAAVGQEIAECGEPFIGRADRHCYAVGHLVIQRRRPSVRPHLAGLAANDRPFGIWNCQPLPNSWGLRLIAARLKKRFTFAPLWSMTFPCSSDYSGNSDNTLICAEAHLQFARSFHDANQ